MSKLDVTEYKTIQFSDLRDLYEEKYGRELDADEIYNTYCNGAYYALDIADWKDEVEGWPEEYEDSTTKRVLDLLLEDGFSENDVILILIKW